MTNQCIPQLRGVSRYPPLTTRRFFLAAVLLLFSSHRTFALDPSLDISQYAHTAWKVRDGFIKGMISTMAQTPDGYLWLGTEFGLYRFDGVRALPWPPRPGEQVPGGVRYLLVAHDGVLWIGTNEGLASWKDGQLIWHPELGTMSVYSVLEDREGTIWAGGQTWESQSGKLCQVRTEGTLCYEQGLGQSVGRTYEDRHGNLWVSTTDGLWHWRPGVPKMYAVPYSISIVEDDRGALLIGNPNGITRFVNGKSEPYSPPDAPGLHMLNSMVFRDRDGGLWIATSNTGLLHVHEGRTDMFTQSDGLSGEFLTAIFEDREGSIWVASATGLDRFRELAVPAISVKQGLSNATVNSVFAARDGNVWVGTVDGLNSWKDGNVAIYRRRRPPAIWPALASVRREIADPGLPGDFIVSLLEDSRRRMWVSTAFGLAYLEKGRFIPVDAVPGRFGKSLSSISEDGRQSLWITYYKGLLRLAEGRVVEEIPPATFGHKELITSATCDPTESGVWLGFSRGGIVHLKDGQVRASYSAADGLGDGEVYHLRFGSRGALWAATVNGLSRIKDGHITKLTTKNGLPCDAVLWTMEDDEHSTWLYTRCGLVRIARSQLDSWASDPKRTVQVSVFDTSDGVPLHLRPPTGYSPTVSKSADGKIWFATGDGVGVVDPRRLAYNKVLPPVHVEQITADGKVYDAANAVRLPTLVRYVDIDYTALSLVVPEKVRFRIKLEGEDKDWRELVNVRRVSYTNLAPKHYRFLVKACNNSGVWNEEGAALDFVIPPAWYQTYWFRAVCVAAFLALLWALYQYRLHQLAQQFNMRLEERVSERTRVARDLHDTLLQSFQGLVFRFQAARNHLPERPEEASEALDSALVSADQALAEGRSSIQDLRAEQLKGSNLEQMLLAMGRELASSQNGRDPAPTLRVIVEGTRQEKRAMIREEIYRIARELLRNAYRHAHARSIEAELRYEEDAFVLIVRDDGKGIDSQVLKDRGRAGHWGLSGMYERAEGMGARLDIWSEAGAGTEARLTVPGAIAYEKSGHGGRFKLFREKRIHEHRS